MSFQSKYHFKYHKTIYYIIFQDICQKMLKTGCFIFLCATSLGDTSEYEQYNDNICIIKHMYFQKVVLKMKTLPSYQYKILLLNKTGE